MWTYLSILGLSWIHKVSNPKVMRMMLKKKEMTNTVK